MAQELVLRANGILSGVASHLIILVPDGSVLFCQHEGSGFEHDRPVYVQEVEHVTRVQPVLLPHVFRERNLSSTGNL